MRARLINEIQIGQTSGLGSIGVGDAGLVYKKVEKELKSLCKKDTDLYTYNEDGNYITINFQGYYGLMDDDIIYYDKDTNIIELTNLNSHWSIDFNEYAIPDTDYKFDMVSVYKRGLLKSLFELIHNESTNKADEYAEDAEREMEDEEDDE